MIEELLRAIFNAINHGKTALNKSDSMHKYCEIHDNI